jgi:hypothetical protein
LYLKDFEKRRAQFQDATKNNLDKAKGGVNVDLSGIDQIYDELDSQENKSIFIIAFTSVTNLAFLLVICFCGFILW